VKYCPNPDCPGQPHPGVRPEFVDTAYRCSDCGTPLVSSPPAPPADPADAPWHARDDYGSSAAAGADEPDTRDEDSDEPAPDWVVVDHVMVSTEAWVACGLLESEGLEVQVRGARDITSLSGLTQAPRGVRLFVHRADLERAQEALDRAKADAAAAPAEADTDAPDPPPPDRVLESNLDREAVYELNEVLEREGIAVRVEPQPLRSALDLIVGPGERYSVLVPAADV
jgi:hypothetical protein